MQKTTGAKASRVFGIYLKEAAKRPIAFFLVVLGMVGLQAGTLIAPLYLRTFFNLLVSEEPSAEAVQALLSVLTFIAGAYALEWASRRLFTFSVISLETSAMASLYDRAFSYLIQHSSHFFSNQFAGTLTRRVSKFAHAFESVFDAMVIQFIPTGIFIAGAVTILYIHNHVIGIMLGVWVVIFFSVQVILMKWQRPIRRIRADEDSKTVGALADAISNQGTITLFSGNEHERSRFRSAVGRWQHAVRRVWNADEYSWSVLGFLMTVIEILVLYGALQYWAVGLLTVGDFVLIQAYLITTFDRLVSINHELRRFNEAVADAGEMVEVLDTPLEISDAPNASPLSVSTGVIEFRDVEFHFSKDRSLLSHFNLKINGGEKVALVGPSGAGKSTVTKLVLRLYDVASGGVYIDGQNIREATQASVRDAIAFVPQEPILFHRTLMENIRYGRRDATDDEVREAARQAHCDEFINATPEGYETFVGERGIRLSGGERQRIAIARAILKDAPILVLDEATSSLDSESEALIQDALAKLMERKTVIAIAHRLSTVMKMDRIVVIEGGNVVTTGTHDELVRHEGGLYKKLWEIQAGGFLIDDEEGGEKPLVKEDEE